MADENDVQITKQKRLLEELRSEHGNKGYADSPGISNGHAESRDDGDRQNARTTSGSYQGTTGRTEGARANNGTSEGLHEGIRPANGTDEYTTKSAGVSNRRRKEDVKPPAPPVPPQFTLKNPFAKLPGKDKEPIRLFSKTEAEQEAERMTEIYLRGSALLDDVLEIVVKDHEPVAIWQLDDSEAAMLATLHLERATKDVGAARSARKLLEIYDKIFFWLVVGPRIKATVDHTVAHKGFSFK